MLVDPINFTIDPGTAVILGMIGDDDPTPRRRATGLYLISHFGMDYCLPGGASYDGEGASWHEYPEIAGYGPYGVCDSPDQLMSHPLGKFLATSERRFTVSLTRIRKCDQPSDGGWRWHKWGEYIGEKSPQYEYLYDEGPEISEVYVFHVYECLDASKAAEP